MVIVVGILRGMLGVVLGTTAGVTNTTGTGALVLMLEAIDAMEVITVTVTDRTAAVLAVNESYS